MSNVKNGIFPHEKLSCGSLIVENREHHSVDQVLTCQLGDMTWGLVFVSEKVKCDNVVFVFWMI
jgi:hypothetical protein